MKKEYDTFVDDLLTLRQGEEIDIAIRDLTPGVTKYDTRYVKAMVADSPEKLPDGEVLWLRFQRGRLRPKPWAIKVVEELGEFKPKEAIVRT